MVGKIEEPSTVTSAIEIPDQISKISPDASLNTQKVSIASTPESSVKPTIANKDIINTSQATLQALVKKLEIAYENGNVKVIAPILANTLDIENKNQKQLREKLNTLFEITAERKMMLYDFKWSMVSDSLQGEGKFLSRYQLVGEKDWLTRTGNALVSAKIVDKNLTITQLGLENPIE